MRVLLMGVFLAGLASAESICGKESGPVAVYCMPDLSPFMPVPEPGPVVQVWIAGDEAPKNYLVRLAHKVGEETRFQWRVVTGGKWAMASFTVEELQPVGVSVLDLDRWEWVAVIP
jgi:hypothetical protein